MSKIYFINCEMCGTPVTSKSAKKRFCTSCAKERDKEQKRMRAKKKAEQELAAPKHTIDDRLKELREKGLSYREWQMQKTLEMVQRGGE